MSKTVFLFGMVIFAVVSWLIGFVNELHEDVNVLHPLEKFTSTSKDNKSYRLDINGNEILELGGFSLEEKKKLWNASPLKVEMINLFPDFSEMKYFIQNRIEDDGSFSREFLSYIEDIQGEYIGGALSSDNVKLKLSHF